jgi:putative transposase
VEADYRIYRHNPPHLFLPDAIYMVTAATYEKKRLFGTPELLCLLRDAILKDFVRRGWQMRAYVVLPNHYHLLAVAPDEDAALPEVVRSIHSYAAHRVARAGQTLGSRVWWNYWDSCITHERSYFARINYIHFNPVKHGYVDDPAKWEYSSFREMCESDPSEAERLKTDYPFDRVEVDDDF